MRHRADLEVVYLMREVGRERDAADAVGQAANAAREEELVRVGDEEHLGGR